MKEKTACIIGIMFAAAVIAFTYLKIIPPEVFIALAGASVAWFYKTMSEAIAARRNK